MNNEFNLLIIENKSLVNFIGGAEKVLVDLANAMAARGMKVSVATNDEIEGRPAFELDKSINFYNLMNVEKSKFKKLTKPRNSFLKIVYEILRPLIKIYNARIEKCNNGEKAYKKHLERMGPLWSELIAKIKPDVIVAFSMETLAEIIYKNDINVPIIASIHTRADIDYESEYTWKPDFLRKINKEICNKVAAMHVLCESYEGMIRPWYHGDVRPISNVVKQNEPIAYGLKNNYKIIMIGRIVFANKQQDMLVKAFAKIAGAYENWNLEIWGEGGDRPRLNRLVDDLGLKDRVMVCGETSKPLEMLQKADVFAFPSCYEGFPLALTEAMGVGLPCVGLKTCSGTNEIIKDETNGLLVDNDVEAFAKGLEKLMSSSELREKLGTQAREDMRHYSDEVVWGKWEEFIKKTAKKGESVDE